MIGHSLQGKAADSYYVFEIELYIKSATSIYTCQGSPAEKRRAPMMG